MRDWKDMPVPHGEGTPWKTENAFWNWLRGNLRRAIWKKNLTKLEHLSKRRFRAPLGKKTKKNPTGMVWACKCDICGETFRQSECEVDHMLPSGSLKSVEDITPFVVRLSFVKDEDLRILDKECHQKVTTADKYGMTIEEAGKLLEVGKKTKQPIKNQKEELLKLGFSEDEISNKEKRKQCYIKILSEGG